MKASSRLFFTECYSQLKNTSDFSFFKVTEYEAARTAKELQDYVNRASQEELQDLKRYDVSIDKVEAHKNQSPIIGCQIKGIPYTFDRVY